MTIFSADLIGWSSFRARGVMTKRQTDLLMEATAFSGVTTTLKSSFVGVTSSAFVLITPSVSIEILMRNHLISNFLRLELVFIPYEVVHYIFEAKFRICIHGMLNNNINRLIITT